MSSGRVTSVLTNDDLGLVKQNSGRRRPPYDSIAVTQAQERIDAFVVEDVDGLQFIPSN